MQLLVRSISSIIHWTSSVVANPNQAQDDAWEKHTRIHIHQDCHRSASAHRSTQRALRGLDAARIRPSFSGRPYEAVVSQFLSADVCIQLRSCLFHLRLPPETVLSSKGTYTHPDRWGSFLPEVDAFAVVLPARCQAANHPKLSRDERRALFQRCAVFLGSADYPSGWFFRSRHFQRGNVLEWLLWALFSTSRSVRWPEEWEDEIIEYMAAVENVLGRALQEGYNEDAPCMRLTLDPVRMLHRPLLWYLVCCVSAWPSGRKGNLFLFRSSVASMS